MSKIDEARKFLEDIGMPKAQQSDICALSLLAMAGIKPSDEWKSASNEWMGQLMRKIVVKHSENRPCIDLGQRL